MIKTKRQVEARRKKLSSAVDLLWMSLIIGDSEKFKLIDEVNKSIDKLIDNL